MRPKNFPARKLSRQIQAQGKQFTDVEAATNHALLLAARALRSKVARTKK